MATTALADRSRSISAMPLLAAGLLLFWLGHATALTADARLSSNGLLAIIGWVALLALWGALSSWLALSGRYRAPAMLSSIPGLWTPAVPVTITVLLIALPIGFREAMIDLATGIGTRDFLLLQCLRLAAIGSIIKAYSGVLPRAFAGGLGVPDALFGLSAVILLATGETGLSPALLITWNAIGAAILLAAPLMLPLTMPGRFQFFRAQPDGTALFRFPMVLAPTLLAPLLLIANLVHIAGLAGVR